MTATARAHPANRSGEWPSATAARGHTRERRDRWRGLVEQMAEGLAYCQMVFDDDGQPSDWIYVDVNAAFGSLTGLRDVIGKRVTEILPGLRETNPQDFEVHARVARTGIPEQYETYVPGLQRWLTVKAFRPQPGHFVAVFENITERRRSEQALRDSIALLDQTQALTKVGGWVYDVALDRVTWTDEVYRIHEVQHEYDPNSPTQDMQFYAAADRERIAEAFRLAVEEGRPYDLELQLITANGREIWVRTRGNPQLEDGRVVRVYGDIADITDQLAAETDLRVAHERLRRFIDANIVGVRIARPDGEIVEANDYYLDLIGATRDELERGQVDWRTVTPPEWLQADERAIAEVRERGVCTPYEKEYVLPSGRRFSVLLVETLLPGPGEELAAFVLDITDRKRAEQEVIALNAELEERVRQRTAALEAANRELEAFSYSVSHDLRAPLRSIDAFSQILLDEHADQLDAEAQRVLGVVVRNSKQMGLLIDDLLAFSRVARREFDRRPVDMDGLARSAIEELRAAEPERVMVFDVGELCAIPGDPALLRQVWTNVLGNAVKFTRPAPQASIEVRCDRGDGECRYTVRDNGVGFDPAYADKLFQPFQRLHSTSEFEGTGIGLAIVTRIVQRHGGHVWAEGTPGAGATFGFALPEKLEAT